MLVNLRAPLPRCAIKPVLIFQFRLFGRSASLPGTSSAADVSEFTEALQVHSLPWRLLESPLLSPGQGAQLGARRVSLHLSLHGWPKPGF